MSRTKLTEPKVIGIHNDNASKIEAIKELIFGETIHEYDSEFLALKKDLLRKKKELESLIKKVKADLDKAINDLGSDVDVKLSGLEKDLQQRTDKLDSAKIDKKILGNLFIKMGEKIGQ
ncbi:MAG: fructose 1,6-bisphosphatase [Flavobacteriaceae bacterium]|nr:fructose 1,6-bisphosphatase [Bacteroidia bacterium]MBT8288861.1 fructose 1,6-bisphosphatase [Bacteroidia bacterium]NNF74384.1 fructose 1,6-bisphosphatase [Flavobacteriaceae bacterium]NNK71591.1 fructose 1,6-bisphosphatase [Flavobacteriaceae bacterium]